MTTKTTPHGAALAAHAAAVAKTADMRRLLTEAQADADRLDAIPAVELLNRPGPAARRFAAYGGFARGGGPQDRPPPRSR